MSTRDAVVVGFLKAIRAAADAALAVLEDSPAAVQRQSKPLSKRQSSDSPKHLDNGLDSSPGLSGQTLSLCSESQQFSENQAEKRESALFQTREDCPRSNGSPIVLDYREDCPPLDRQDSRFDGIWDGLGGAATSGTMRSRIRSCIPLFERTAIEHKAADAVAFACAAAKRFKADSSVKAKRLGLGTFLDQFESWTTEAAAAPKPLAHKLLTADDHAAELERTPNPEWAR